MDERHCENCGRIIDRDAGVWDGYTSCCNELVCSGWDVGRYGIPTDNVEACCWGQADREYARQGREAPDGSYRVE